MTGTYETLSLGVHAILNELSECKGVLCDHEDFNDWIAHMPASDPMMETFFTGRAFKLASYKGKTMGSRSMKHFVVTITRMDNGRWETIVNHG